MKPEQMMKEGDKYFNEMVITEKTTTKIIPFEPGTIYPETDTLITYEEQNRILAIAIFITSIILFATLFM